jgi:hypothetical protein
VVVVAGDFAGVAAEGGLEEGDVGVGGADEEIGGEVGEPVVGFGDGGRVAEGGEPEGVAEHEGGAAVAGMAVEVVGGDDEVVAGEERGEGVGVDGGVAGLGEGEEVEAEEVAGGLQLVAAGGLAVGIGAVGGGEDVDDGAGDFLAESEGKESGEGFVVGMGRQEEDAGGGVGVGEVGKEATHGGLFV